MRILYFKWNSFGAEDIYEGLVHLGHEVIISSWDHEAIFRDEKLQTQVIEMLRSKNFDVAFSSDYYPPIAVSCNEVGIPYIAWVYDSPYVSLYSFTVSLDTNYIFVFDSEVYREFRNKGIKTVYYMPLASNPKRLRHMVEDDDERRLFENSIFCNKSDIAFVGAMYNEENTFYRKMEGISEATRGYIEGVIAAQKQIWGYNFVRSLMRKDVLDEMNRAYPLTFNEDCAVSQDYVYAEYCVNREITSRERLEYLIEIGKKFSLDKEIALDLYTMNEELHISGIYNHGFVDPYKIAPFVYNKAKVNLNITLRSIHAGIPLRVFEILGSGGFLLSNYQADFSDCFTEAEDYVYYENKKDMIDKIEYYLSHDKERRDIAANGLRKTLKNHTYEHRLKLMLEYI